MSSVVVDPWLRERLEPFYTCRNGQLVSADFQTKLSELCNQIIRMRPKEHASFGTDIGSVAKRWRFAGHTSPMAGTIVLRAVIGKTTTGANPGATLTLTNSAGTTIAQGTTYGGLATGESVADTPDEWVVQTLFLDARTFQNTSFRAELATSGEGKLIAATIYEYAMPPDTSYGYINQQFSVGQGIYEVDRKAIVDMAIALWKRGAAPLWNFSSQTDATAPSSISGSWVNIIDASTTVTANSPGFWVDLRACNTKVARPNVPCRFEAFLSAPGGTIHGVRIVDSTGTAVVTQSPLTPAAGGTWFQTTMNLPPTHAKYDVQFQSDAVNTLKCYAVSVYQYAS